MVPPEQLERVRANLAKRKSPRVRGQGLAESLAKQLSIPVMDAREALSDLHSKGELSAADWHPQFGPQGMVTLNLDIRTEPDKVAWSDAMQAAGIEPGEANCLMPAYSVLSGMTQHDLIAIATGLVQLRESQEIHYGENRFLVSAKYLISSSKILDTLPNAALKAYGINIANFPPAPSYVMVAGASNPKAVVLIENPQAFELAIKSKVSDVVWITTYGYGLSRGGDASGSQLASIIESGQMIDVVREGNPPPLKQLIKHPHLTFWGDLDPAGLHIFHRLQQQLPQLQLSALYNPMIEQLQAGGGHPYIKATGKEGQLLQAVSDPIAKALFDLCSERGVDQEVVKITDFSQSLDVLVLSLSNA